MDSNFIILPNMYLSFLSWQEYIGINDYSFEMENQKSDSRYILIEIFESNIWDNIMHLQGLMILYSSRGIYETEIVFKGMKDQFNSIFVLNIARSIKILQQSFFICNRHPIISKYILKGWPLCVKQAGKFLRLAKMETLMMWNKISKKQIKED